MLLLKVLTVWVPKGGQAMFQVVVHQVREELLAKEGLQVKVALLVKQGLSLARVVHQGAMQMVRVEKAMSLEEEVEMATEYRLVRSLRVKSARVQPISTC